MKNLTKLITILVFSLSTLLGNTAFAADEDSLPAVSGYDVVAYHTKNKAVKGSGWHVASHEGQNYLFSSKRNKRKIEKKPSKYVPAYNGWCAYGVAVKKKFYADPEIFEVVDGTLYLNLDKKIQKDWVEKKIDNISKANKNWKIIADKAMDKL